MRPSPSSRVLDLPPSGRAFVLSDLHGGWPDWVAFSRKTEVLERIADGEDLWLVLTGDVPDVARHRTVDARVPDDGDVRILDLLCEARERLGSRAERIVYVEGNHDYHVARVCFEVARFEAARVGATLPRRADLPTCSPAAYERFCEHYKEAYGEGVLANNVLPYDMVPRVTKRHLELITGGPVLARLGASGVAIAHAGPTRMEGVEASWLRAQIERASPDQLSGASPEDYFAAPYHQLLNGRYRHGDYSVEDLTRFLELFEASVLVSGHTPHPYLLDLERVQPMGECVFRNGLGIIGGRQVVLCSSFGAFLPRYKRYLEVDLSRPYQTAIELAEDEGSVHALYGLEDCRQLEGSVRPLPGLEVMDPF